MHLMAVALLCAPAVTAQATGVEVQALRTFYEATDGANWRKNTNWLSGDPCINKWSNVIGCGAPMTAKAAKQPTKAAAHSSITGLNLAKMGMRGTVPTQLGLLSKLGAISVRINEISGTLPSELGALKELKALGVYSNRISGTVPTQLAQLTPSTCWLNHAQCRTALDEDSCGPNDNRNLFSCPLPELGGPCFQSLGIDCESDDRRMSEESPPATDGAAQPSVEPESDKARRKRVAAEAAVDVTIKADQFTEEAREATRAAIEAENEQKAAEALAEKARLAADEARKDAEAKAQVARDAVEKASEARKLAADLERIAKEEL